jgi:actin-like ATPase involved in cell morphogenesis
VTGTYSTGNGSSADGYLVILVPTGSSDVESTGFNRTVDPAGNGTGAFTMDVPSGTYDVRVLSTDGTLVAQREGVVISGDAQDLDPLAYGDNVG